MEKTGKIILVTGATARHLLAAGWQVRAFSRDRNSPAAQALHRAGAEIAEGDHNNRGLDELLLLAIPIADEAKERRQLLHLIGSL